MRSCIGRLSIILAFVFGAVYPNDAREPERGEGQNRLLPFTPAFAEELRPLLEKKLLVTPANYGRMIRMHGPPDVGESAVSLYSDDSHSEGAQCHVTLTRAQANLDYIFANHRDQEDPFQEVNKVQVIRQDAPIPEKTANAFRACLLALMPAQQDDRLRPSRTVGDFRVEFWIVEQDGTRRGGEKGERHGKDVETLIRIGDLLARYCEVEPSEREAIGEEIEKEAARILSSNHGKR